MKLLTKEILKKFEKTGSQDGLLGEAKVIVKFFTPDADWTWYALEYDPTTRIFFGIVDGMEIEYGRFSLDELLSVRGKIGLPIERDMYFGNPKVNDIRFPRGQQWFQSPA